jgi:hypothetical protein
MHFNRGQGARSSAGRPLDGLRRMDLPLSHFDGTKASGRGLRNQRG